jgi:hypothetical protein
MDTVSSNELLPGPQVIFVCGLPFDAGEKLSKLFEKHSIPNTKVIHCTNGMVNSSLNDSLTKNFNEDPVPVDKLPPVLVFSGLKISIVQKLISDFNMSNLPRPIFATTTQHNLSFTVKELIMHLLEERREQLKGQNS